MCRSWGPMPMAAFNISSNFPASRPYTAAVPAEVPANATDLRICRSVALENAGTGTVFWRWQAKKGCNNKSHLCQAKGCIGWNNM